MSESNGSTLAKVVPRWQKLEQDLRTLSTVHKELMGNFYGDQRAPSNYATRNRQEISFCRKLLDPEYQLNKTSRTDRPEQQVFYLPWYKRRKRERFMLRVEFARGFKCS